MSTNGIIPEPKIRLVTWSPGDVWPEGRNIRWNAYTDLLSKGATLTEQAVLVLANGNSEFNYWFIKKVLKTPGLPQEAKVQLAMPHVQLVFAGENQEIFEKLASYLQHKPAWKNVVSAKARETKTRVLTQP